MIRIGVTGHRVLTEVDKIDAGIESALDGIARKWSGEKFKVISALAEGADRMVANHVLAIPMARLVAVLPMCERDYISDFDTETSRSEFLNLIDRADEIVEIPVKASRDEAYEAAGVFVLDNSDVLITVWDGNESQGRGGSADIVALARSRQLPIAWVHAGNRKPGTKKPASLGDDQGLVTFENF